MRLVSSFSCQAEQLDVVDWFVFNINSMILLL